MRSLLGLPLDTLQIVVLVLVGLLGLAFATLAVRNPLMLRLAWRNVPRRPGLTALITLGLTLGTVILSTAFTTGDTMSLAVRTVVAGVLGSADEVVFVPAQTQRNGFDLVQAVANGSFLTGITAYFPETEVERVLAVTANQPAVAGVLPAILEQISASGGEEGSFRAGVNVLGAPPDLAPGFEPLRSANGNRTLSLSDLADDQVYANTEAMAALGVGEGQTLHLYGAAGERAVTVRAVARLGDLGGGQAALFVPLARLQGWTGRTGQVNQILLANSGSAAQRLQASWPVTVALRSAFLDDGTVQRLFQALAQPAAIQAIQQAQQRGFGSQQQKLSLLLKALVKESPTPEFAALIQDPEVLGRLGGGLSGGAGGDRGRLRALAGPGTLRVLDVQQIAQNQADLWGSAFTDLFVVLGSFALFSGVLLIVLVFSLVALDRRPELGVLRALGSRRRDAVVLLVVEGTLYALLSSLFGLLGGVLVAMALVGYAGQLVSQYGFRLETTVAPGSILLSFGLGLLLTVSTVAVTAWRSTRFSIVTAMRDLGDPGAIRLVSIRQLLPSAVTALIGAALVWQGYVQRWSLAYATGVMLTVIGVTLAVRWGLRRGGADRLERAVFTLAGVVLIGWWLVPPIWLEAIGLGAFPAVPEMSFFSGVSMLLGAVWLLTYNVGLLRLVPGRTPLWRMSTAYVATNRFRTGMALAMFGVVVLSLTVSAVLLTATNVAYGDPDVVSGGWDVRAESDQPPHDLGAELLAAGLPATAFAGLGGTATLPVSVVELDQPGARWQSTNLTVVDPAFATSASVGVVAGQPWSALAQQPGTALIGAALLNAPTGSSVQLVGSDSPAEFRSITLWLRDERSLQSAVSVEVVGLLDARGPWARSVMVGASTVAMWPTPDRATYYLRTPPTGNVRDVTSALAVAAPSLRVYTVAEDLRLVQGVRGLLGVILQGFMGIGLLAGVAALGTLSARAVVERRRQIGMLRALGFTARHVGLGLLAESAIMALLGSLLGVAVGLVVANAAVQLLSRTSPELRFGVPVAQIGLIVLTALIASLLLTLLPASQAARLSPAEALREA